MAKDKFFSGSIRNVACLRGGRIEVWRFGGVKGNVALAGGNKEIRLMLRGWGENFALELDPRVPACARSRSRGKEDLGSRELNFLVGGRHKRSVFVRSEGGTG